ncbi:MAG: TonB-dependent receptor, partial [Candidatus Eisenbacteria bacterium]|nr:TonB-dependent receptor [Candidatus Eisenbacteria bacterium]
MSIPIGPSSRDARRARFLRVPPIPRIVALLLLALAIASQAIAQTTPGTGMIVGRIFDSKTGKPLPFTNISVVGTALGTIARDDGTFVLPNVPVGVYELQASFMGYTTTKVEVEVREKRTTETEIRLQDTTVGSVDEVIVTAERPLVDVEAGATVRSVNAEEIKNLIIQPTLDSVVEQQAGVTRDRDQIHIRGGRADETLYVIEGTQMRDLLSGESQGGSAVGAKAVAEVNVITGGFDAKYGQALSGIVEAKLKEGSEEYHGFAGYTTDALTDDWDVDQADFQIGGPLPLVSNALHAIGGEKSGQVTFFMDVASELQNGYLPSITDTPGAKLHSGYQDRFLGSSFNYEDFFYPRGDNDWRLLFKSAWKASPNHKFSVSWLKHLSVNQGFNDTDIAQINRNTNNYPWVWSRRLDHYYTVTDDQNSFSFTWNHTVKTGLLQQVKVTRYFTSRHQDVGGKRWDEYDTVTDASLLPEFDTPYFRDAGEPT